MRHEKIGALFPFHSSTSMSKLHILVTGGAGFIGSHLSEKLLAEGHAVTCLDNLDPYYDPEIKRANIETAGSSRSFRFVEGNILDSDAVDEALDDGTGQDTAVVHLAGLAGVRNMKPRINRHHFIRSASKRTTASASRFE